MNQDIPKPITFNPTKHHLHFLERKIKEWQAKDWSVTEMELRTIGTNLLDLYLGILSVKNICDETLFYFYSTGIKESKSFYEWLYPADYRKIKLSDNSEWVIKKGDDLLRYIHIHPGKRSNFTARIRATTLKTVIALKVHFPEKQSGQLPSLEEVNEIRTTFLQLSPVKKLQHEKGILRLWELFNSL